MGQADGDAEPTESDPRDLNTGFGIQAQFNFSFPFEKLGAGNAFCS